METVEGEYEFENEEEPNVTDPDDEDETDGMDDLKEDLEVMMQSQS